MVKCINAQFDSTPERESLVTLELSAAARNTH